MKVFLALLFSLIASVAEAQNPTCPTRPAGDSTNACSSTAFTQNAASNPIPPFNVAAPGVFTNTQQNDLATFLLNGISPSTEFSTHQGGNFATEALAAGVLIPNTSTVYQVNGIGCYVKSNAAQVSTGGYVCGYFSSFANANNANMFGINPVVGDAASLSGVKLQNEFDFVVNNTATVVTGISMQMSGTAQATSATALACQTPAAGKIWSTCLFSADGAVTRGAYLGTNGTANSVPSQQLQFGGRGAGGAINTATINGDLNGVLQFNGGALAVASGGTGDTGTAWTTFTPSYVCGTATFTNNSSRSKTLGKTTWIQIDVTITAIGTCTQPLAFVTPNTVNSTAVLAGINQVATPKGAQCVVFNPTTANCYKADGTAWLVNDRLIASGVYENQ